MRKKFSASMIGLISGAVCFFILAALLVIILLVIGARRHAHPDLTLAVKVALPAAALTTVAGFIIAKIRLATIDKDK
ncbi:MAG TPA: hypothetical protein VKH81_14160 [Candidatus Angelobacter sp.]|nr:hypothetical protein [Candidatus Angelobacter sp.]